MDLRNIVTTTVVAAGTFALGVVAARALVPSSTTVHTIAMPPMPSTPTTPTSTPPPPPPCNPTSYVQLIDAVDFSAYKHRNQRRKNAQQLPYINHPISVARRLVQANVSDLHVLIAAILHDTVEDTDTTLDEICQRFGPQVAAIVDEVSDDKTLAKAVRKQLQIEHAPTVSPCAKLVKLADKLDNLTDLLTVTPIGWESQRVAEYFNWAAKVIDGLRGTNPILESQLDQVLSKRHIAIEAAAQPSSG